MLEQQSAELRMMDAKMNILHELEVQQLELEMQNEELIATRADLEESLKWYLFLYDFAPEGYFTVDNSGLISEMSLSVAKLPVNERSLLKKSNFKTLIAVESWPVFNIFFAKNFLSM